ncbi:MAG: ArsR family transcriptional regulator [archaeon]
MKRITDQNEKSELQIISDAIQCIKTEVKGLRQELTRIESSIIEDRVSAVETALSTNRLLLFANQLEEDIDEDIDNLMISDCHKGMKTQCSQKFKKLLAESLNVIKNSNVSEAIEEIDSRIVFIEKALDKFKGEPCEVCHENFQKKLHKDKKMLRTLVLSKNNPVGKPSKIIDFSEMSERVFEPLASPIRLKILNKLSQGKQSYTRLAKLTGLRAGHLIYHINKLLDAGLIGQEDNKGDYIISNRGMEVTKKISELPI